MFLKFQLFAFGVAPEEDEEEEVATLLGHLSGMKQLPSWLIRMSRLLFLGVWHFAGANILWCCLKFWKISVILEYSWGQFTHED